MLLALPEFSLLDARVVVDGTELEVVVELPRDLQACPRCGVIDAHEVHDRTVHRVRHLPVAGRACRVAWDKRVLVCEAGCGAFVERASAIEPRAVWTNPARRTAVAEVADNIPVDRVRRAYGVGWSTVMRAVLAEADTVPLPDASRVGIDETVMVAGRTRARARRYVTALVDLDTGLVVEIAEGRDTLVARRLLADHAGRVNVVACDLFSPFRTAAEQLAGVTVVADVFHVVRLGVAMLDAVRRRRQQQTLGHRGRKHDPLYRIRMLLRVGIERLAQDVLDEVFTTLRAADSDDEVGAAWVALDLLRAVYAAPDRDTAHRRLVAFYEWVAMVEVDEVTTLATSIDRWQDQVLAYFDTGASNGPTESTNVKIKNVRRAARGFRNFDNYRARILVHAGRPRSLRHASQLRGPNAITAA